LPLGETARCRFEQANPEWRDLAEDFGFEALR